jgi:hypothetical protein
MGIIVNNIFLAIPFYLIWNSLAPIYLTNLPPAYQDVPFWHIVGLFTLFSLIRLALSPKSPGSSFVQFKKFDFGSPYRRQQDFSTSENNIKDVTPNK